MMSPYFEQAVMNAEPVELVRMLIQKTLLCLREAREHLRRGRIAERALRIGDAYACLAELHRSLRPEVDPALVTRLQGLNLYMMRRLKEAKSFGEVGERWLQEARMADSTRSSRMPRSITCCWIIVS